jgi:hypothetical protein
MFENLKKLSDRIRAEFGIPPSKEPLPDLMEMKEPDTKMTGDVIYYPKEMVESLKAQFTQPVNAHIVAGWVSYKFNHSIFSPPPLREHKPDSEPFETNMMEALVGWRAWKLDLKKMALRSQNSFFDDDEKHLLRPGIPMVAYCGKAEGNTLGRASVFDPAGILPAPPVHNVPAEFCSCGIYAKDTLDEVISATYKGIYGQVYGWGRYVRGDQGWRAQYAYPKRFYLTRNYAREISPDTLDFLRTYRVPIFVEQPTLLYNPEEDGYEYRDDEENWNFGADKNPDAEED